MQVSRWTLIIATFNWHNSLVVKHLDIPSSVLDIGHLLSNPK